MNIKQAILKAFNSSNYTATVQLVGSSQAYRKTSWWPAQHPHTVELITGRELAVLFFDDFRGIGTPWWRRCGRRFEPAATRGFFELCA